EPPQAARVEDRAREQVRARLLAFLDHRHRHFAEALRGLRALLEELSQPERAGEPGRPGADDQDPDLDRIGVAGPAECLLDPPGRRGPRRDRTPHAPFPPSTRLPT